MNRRAGAKWCLPRNQLVAGSSVATTGVPASAARASAAIPSSDGAAEVIGGEDSRESSSGQLGAARRGQLVGVEAEGQAVVRGGAQDAAALVGGEDAVLAEDVAEAGDPLAGHGRQLLVDDAGDIRVGPRVGAVAVLRRDGVRAEECRHQLDGPLAAEPADQVQQPQFRGDVQAVSGLGFRGRRAAGQHLSQAGPAAGQQLLVGRGARRSHRREDPAAGGQDLEIAGATGAELPLGLARAGEEQVRVGVDEPGRDEAASRVETAKGVDREPPGRDLAVDLVGRAGGEDPPFPTRHGEPRHRTPTPASPCAPPRRRPPASVAIAARPFDQQTGHRLAAPLMSREPLPGAAPAPAAARSRAASGNRPRRPAVRS